MLATPFNLFADVFSWNLLSITTYSQVIFCFKSLWYNEPINGEQKTISSHRLRASLALFLLFLKCLFLHMLPWCIAFRIRSGDDIPIDSAMHYGPGNCLPSTFGDMIKTSCAWVLHTDHHETSGHFATWIQLTMKINVKEHIQNGVLYFSHSYNANTPT